MGEVIHNKLVRDGIPEIIKKDGQRPAIRTLSAEAYRRALLDKLVEEASELRDSDGDIGERADVAEVLRALDIVLGFKSYEVERTRAAKAEKRGGFEQRIFLESVQTDD